MNLTIITACPSGVANSIIAAGLLEKAAQALNWTANIECQSNVIPYTEIDEAIIDASDVVIIAANREVDDRRFVGKKVYRVDVEEVIHNAQQVLKDADAKAVLLEVASQSEPVCTDSEQQKRIVAITACPTGVAHTFMAAEALEKQAQAMGHQIKVETRGSVGAKNQLSAQEIADADLVIIAADIEVPLERFNGKKLYKTSTGL